MKELWKPVPGFFIEVLASSMGRVRIVRYNGKPTFGKLSSSNGKYRRRVIHIRMGSRKTRKTFRVHRLICTAFHGLPPFEDAKCLHIDEDSLNNRPENLKWGTQKENLNAPGFLADRRSRTGNNSAWAKHWKRQSI